jgi:hypothetical protein
LLKKLVKVILILLLLTAILTVLFACSNNDPDPQNPGGGGGPTIPTPPNAELAEKITSGLKLAGRNVANQNIRHVRSQFTAVVNRINVTIFYEADYNLNRKQDSEIALTVYDNQYQRSTLFVYYYSGDLFYKINGGRSVVPDFGGSSSFDMFYNLITMFDIESYLFADPDAGGREEFPDEDDVYGIDAFSTYMNMIVTGAESSSLSLMRVGDNEENITISKVSLDKAKDTINDFFSDTVKAGLGGKLDALSSMLFGIKVSDLGDIGIGVIDASKIKILIKNDAVTGLDITFDGMQSDNINSFSVNIQYYTSGASSRVTLDKYDDPALSRIVSTADQAAEYPDGYVVTRAGENYLTGTIYIDALDATFYTELRGNLTASDNQLNTFLLDVRNKTLDLEEGDPHYKNESVLSLFYNYKKWDELSGRIVGDEALYIDASGLNVYMGGGFDLTSLNFPKVRIDNIDIAQEMNLLYSYIFSFVGGDISSPNVLELLTAGLTSGQGSLGMLLSRIKSNGNIIELNLDSELLGSILGNYSTNIVEWIASKMGIGEDVVENLLGVGAFDDLSVKISFDTGTGQILISLYTGGARLFVLSLYRRHIFTEDFKVEPPIGFLPEDYGEFITPAAVDLHAEAELRMQGSERVDLSKLMGVFIGDVTGKNTPFTFGTSDMLYISIDVWYVDGISRLQAYIWSNPVFNGVKLAQNITSAPLFIIRSSPADPGVYLIDALDGSFADSSQIPVKYSIGRDVLTEGFTALLGEGNLFTNANLIGIYNVLTRDAEVFLGKDYLTFTLAPYTANQIRRDPIYELIGIESMNAEFKVRINFTAPSVTVNPADYPAPEIQSLADIAFESMYSATRYDSVKVFFGGGKTISYILTFAGESAELKTGVYHYTPTAYLFGKQISYIMILSDTVNGTKKIAQLELSKLSIDPSAANPIPNKLGVVYDDGAIGEQPYIIEGFPYDDETVKLLLDGMKVRDYYVVIGKGSIAEKTFVLPIEVLNRRVVASNFIGPVPIVASLAIDPYDYSLRKLQSSSYDPLAPYRTFTLTFRSNVTEGAVVTETVSLDWRFDESLIRYDGGVYYIYSYYNSIRLAMQINIVAKIVDYLQVTGERPGQYTVDSLVSSTYIIPTGSTASAELRVYFKSKDQSVPARYRILGTPPENWTNEDPNCDGYYPQNLVWLYPAAQNVTLDMTVNPLGANGSTNRDAASFGDSIAGSQTVTLTVLSPSRRLSQMTDNVQAITRLGVLPNGNIDPLNTVWASVRISAAGYGNIGGMNDIDGRYWEVDPYETSEHNRMPSFINMTVEYAGNMIRKAYPVRWIESTIIDSFGNVLNPTSEEAYLAVTGRIGEVAGNIQTVTMIVHNRSGAAQGIVMADPNAPGEPVIERGPDGKYTIAINPYESYALPASFKLYFGKDELGNDKFSVEYPTDWYIVGTGGSSVHIGAGYLFPYSAATYELTTYVAPDPANGVLAQTVKLYVRIDDMTIVGNLALGYSSDMDNGVNVHSARIGSEDIRYVDVDPYEPSSAVLLEKLINNSTRVGVAFINNGDRTDNVPVEWNASELAAMITALRSPLGSSAFAEGIVTMHGKIFNGTALEQNISFSVKVFPRVITDLIFSNLNDLTNSYVTGGIITYGVSYKGRNGATENRITVDLLKPFALVEKMNGLADKNGGTIDYSVPGSLDKLITNFVDMMLGRVYIYFESIHFGLYPLTYALPANFDGQAFENSDLNELRFIIQRLSEGSSGETFEYLLRVHNDYVEEQAMRLYVETLNDNGTAKYGGDAPYYLPTTIRISYLNSGDVNYTKLIWHAEVVLTGATPIERDEDGKYIGGTGGVTIDDEVAAIPVSAFGQSEEIWLYTILMPQNIPIRINVTFFKKDIKGKNYNAAAAEGYDRQYSITAGIISISDIYSLYPFDPSKIPTRITPFTTADFELQDASKPIVFTIARWIPGQAFAAPDGSFSQSRIDYYFNSGGFSFANGPGDEDDTIFATAEISYYGRIMTITLRVDVAALDPSTAELWAPGVPFTYSEAGGNHAALDPYLNNFGGRFPMPSSPAVTFTNATPDVRHAFSGNVSYQILLNDNGYAPISGIDYNYGGIIADPSWNLEGGFAHLRAVLPDGKAVYFTIGFASRNLQSVGYLNKATKAAGGFAYIEGYNYTDPGGAYRVRSYYFIDPYDASTFDVPATAKFKFFVGEDLVLPSGNWTIVDSDGVELTNVPFSRIYTGSGDYYYSFSSGFPDAYKGGIYTLRSGLSGYGVDTQYFELTVVVLNRSLANKITENTFSWIIRNPIADLLTDIEAPVNAGVFVQLDSSYRSIYEAISEPVVPEITWLLIANNDITAAGMPARIVSGNLSSGNVIGEDVKMTLSVPRWEFKGLAKIVDGVPIPIDESVGFIIEFNPITLRSTATSFRVYFRETNLDTGIVDEGKYADFTPYYLNSYLDPALLASVIDWGEVPIGYVGGVMRDFYVVNHYKSYSAGLHIVNLYKYVTRLVEITEISFGYGSGSVYADDFGYGANGQVSLVIDPINPVVPTKALARGRDVNPPHEPMDFGEIGVTFDPIIRSMIVGGGMRQIAASLTGTDMQFMVNVYYLDRTPVNIYTRDSGFSTLDYDSVNQRYALMARNGSVYDTYFRIDPISRAVYIESTRSYRMPSNIIITYRNYASGSVEANALGRLGSTLTLIPGTSGFLTLGRTIELTGTTTPINVTISNYKVTYTDSSGALVTSPEYGASGLASTLTSAYILKLNVRVRTVEYTSISTMVTPTDGSLPYQQATSSYFIDPYAVFRSFPSLIMVKFTEAALEDPITVTEWIYDEDYLKDTRIITGRENGAEINPDRLNLMAYIRVYGTLLGINFPIKPRYIDTKIPGTSGTMPIKGGTVYVLKGYPLVPQLPTYLYYKFTYLGVEEIAEVPLEFTDSRMSSLSTNSLAVYPGVRATLGNIDRDNIEFTIEVIDPIVYMQSDAAGGRGGFVYDNVLVATDGVGLYAFGREETVLPARVIINDSGKYLEVIGREYYPTPDLHDNTGYMVFNCRYVFLSASDSSLIGGAAGGENANKLNISFRVPITTYDHTSIDEALVLRNPVMETPLGVTIRASQMPSAYSLITESYHKLIWDMTGLNVNKAGDYSVRGFYKDYSGTNLPLTLIVRVVKKTALESDIRVSAEWLNREYTGQAVPVGPYLTISDFLRSDGLYGAPESWKAEYSYDGGLSWTENQPFTVASGGYSYKLRITILDYNIQGSRVFDFTIRQKIIRAGTVTFQPDINSPASNDITYEYDGTEKLPYIAGIPAGSSYTIKYELRNPGSDTYSESRPLNAGEYRVTITFPNQLNFVTEISTFTAKITITKKSVTYMVRLDLVYNGRERDAEITGLPEVLGDITVSYVYYDEDRDMWLEPGSKIKNVGTYKVWVTINGGLNYPSANPGEYANLTGIEFIIHKKEVELRLNELRSEYLQPLLPFDSAVTLVDHNDDKLPGLQGDDTLLILKDKLNVRVQRFDRDLNDWVWTNLSYKNMVGEYRLVADEGIELSNYDIKIYKYGAYKITADAEGAVVIASKAQLTDAINFLADNMSVKWYLEAGNYGDIVINKNVTISIVGSYDLSLETERIAVFFDSITILKGGVTVDIVKMAARAGQASIDVGAGASDVTISRSEFYRAGTVFLTGSIAVRTAVGYAHTLTMTESKISGYTSAVYMLDGSADIRNSAFNENVGGVQLRNPVSVVILNNKFNYTKGSALYILAAVSADNLAVNGNEFVGNVTAIRTYAAVNREILQIQNFFKYNAANIETLY